LVGLERDDLTPQDAPDLGANQPSQLRDPAMRLPLKRQGVDQLDLLRVHLGRSTKRRASGPEGGQASGGPLRDQVPLNYVDTTLLSSVLAATDPPAAVPFDQPHGRSDRGMSGRVAALVSGQLTSRGGVAQQVSQGHQPASWGDGERLGLGREKGGDLSA